MISDLGGLRFFRKGDGEEWQSWASWPHLVLCTDRGPDNFAAINALCYKSSVRINVSPWFDGSHDAWRSVLEAIRETGSFAFVILILIACNLGHGPDATDMRHTQMRNASEALFKVHTHEDCSLFDYHLGDLVKEYESVLSAGEHESVEAGVWSQLRHFSLYKNKGYKANLNRFQSFIREGRKLLDHWWSTLLVCEFTALEMNMLSNTALRAKLRLKTAAAGDDGSVAQSTSATSVDTKAIRSCAQNALVVSMLTLQERRHHRMLSVFVVGAGPVEQWHSHQNKMTRDVQNGSAWAISEVSGAYMQHVSALMLLLASEGATLACGFGTPGGEGSKHIWTPEEIMSEDDFADLLGMYCMLLATARLKRFASNLCSWPWSMLRILDPAHSEQAVIAEFKEHYDCYSALESAQNPTKAIAFLKGRSHFELLSVEQLVLALSESAWAPSQRFSDMMRQRSLSIFGSQICEDVNNVQKNDRSIAGCQSSGMTHYRRPESSYAAAVVRGVVENIHRFSRPALRTAVVRRSAALEQACFRPQVGSLPFGTIASTSPKADHWSPGPGNATAPAGDHELVRASLAQGGLSFVGNAWLGKWCMAKHRIVFTIRGHGPAEEWYMAMLCLDRSSCLVWPVSVHQNFFSDGSAWVCPLPCTKPKLIPIISLDGVVGFTFSWRSWAWQQSRLTQPGVAPGIRAVRDANSAVEGIMALCARNAWFEMGKADILDFHEYLGFAKPAASALFDVVFKVCKDILEITDAEVMLLMGVRFANLQSNTAFFGDILEVDEAQGVLDEQDRSELRKVQASVEERQNERKEFVEKLKQQRAKLSGSVSRAQAKRSKTTAPSPLDGYKGPKKMPNPGREQLAQKDLRQMMPPKAFIWVARNIRAWCSRVPPLPQRTVYWHTAGGEDNAAREAIADAWTKFLEIHGLPLSDCPIAGLLAGGSTAASSAG